MIPSSSKPPKIGLALGSGSARGLAHIGVIRALRDADIQVDYVVGTSIGALVGAVYAAGKIDSLHSAYLAMDWKKIAYFFDVVFPKSGIIDGKKVADFMREYVHSSLIEELPMPFKAVATDFGSGEEVIFETGDLIEAVRASISVPGIFTPVRMHGRVLIDGGLVNPVPVNVVRNMGADIVIAVDLNHEKISGRHAVATKAAAEKGTDESGIMQTLSELGGGRYREALERIEKKLHAFDDNPTLMQARQWLAEESLPNIFEVLLTSINIMESQITRNRLQMDHPDVLIQPRLGSVRFLEFNRAAEIIAIGYDAMRQQLDALPSDYFTRSGAQVDAGRG